MNAITDTESVTAPAATPAQVRPFYWSVKRELWEHRSLYVAPLVAASVVLLGFVFNAVNLTEGLRLLVDLPPQRQRTMVSGFYGSIAVVIAIVMAATAWFYSLDALQGERRDRSVLFWKSLPVSDTTAVLSKLFTAAIVAPAITFIVVVLTQLLILLLGTVVVLIGGANPLPLWSNLQLFQLTIALVYGLMVLSLWYAPIYAWLLLVSAWAKRSTFLWAVLPPLGVLAFEKLAFDTDHIQRLLAYRFNDGLRTAFVADIQRQPLFIGPNNPAVPGDILQLLDPIRFLSNPYLWIGLVAAAGLIAASIWMRRYREPN